jgi:predicted TIM-barrel fold metal-dependent hydrolase
MIDDALVIDAVIHGFDFRPANMAAHLPPGTIWKEAHVALTPKDPKYADYLLDAERWERKFTAEELVSAVFRESLTDIAVYHVVRRGLGGMSLGEWSPMDVALRARELAGKDRVFIYGGLTDPFDTSRSIDELDQMIEQSGMIGLKFYPWELDGKSGSFREFVFSEEDVAFPLIEHCLKRGIKNIAVHKAMGYLVRAFGVSDLDRAVMAFPEMNFEIVHAGWAFLDDTAILAARPNVYLNIEAVSSLVGTAPRRFAEIIGRFLRHGGGEANAEDRLLWGSGVSAVHPRPLLELFWDFEMPKDLVEGYGYPELTIDIKKKILGGNYARRLGATAAELSERLVGDDIWKAQQEQLSPPWSKVPQLAG